MQWPASALIVCAQASVQTERNELRLFDLRALATWLAILTEEPICIMQLSHTQPRKIFFNIFNYLAAFFEQARSAVFYS